MVVALDQACQTQKPVRAAYHGFQAKKLSAGRNFSKLFFILIKFTWQFRSKIIKKLDNFHVIDDFLL